MPYITKTRLINDFACEILQQEKKTAHEVKGKQFSTFNCIVFNLGVCSEVTNFHQLDEMNKKKTNLSKRP